MAKFDKDGNPICNSGRYYRSHQAKNTDTITGLYKNGYNARSNYEFIKGSGFCLEKKSDPGCALDRAAFVAAKDKLTEERDLFDVSFNYFKNKFRLKDRLYQDCIATAGGDSASFLTDLENERRTCDISINKITEERDNLRTRNTEIEGKLSDKNSIIDELQTDLMKAQECCDSKTTQLETTENQLVQAEDEIDDVFATMNTFSVYDA